MVNLLSLARQPSAQVEADTIDRAMLCGDTLVVGWHDGAEPPEPVHLHPDSVFTRGLTGRVRAYERRWRRWPTPEAHGAAAVRAFEDALPPRLRQALNTLGVRFTALGAVLGWLDGAALRRVAQTLPVGLFSELVRSPGIDAERRTAAVLACPVLLPVVMAAARERRHYGIFGDVWTTYHDLGPSKDAAVRLLKAIDRGQPAAAALAAAFGLEPGAAPALAAIRLDAFLDTPRERSIDALEDLGTLRLVRPDLWPDTAQAWEGFRVVRDTMSVACAARGVRNRDTILRHHLEDAAETGWAAFRDHASLAPMRRAIGDITTNLVRATVDAHGLDHPGFLGSGVGSALGRRFGLDEMRTLGERWTAARAAIGHTLVGRFPVRLKNGNSWPALTAPYTAVNGWALTSLTDTDQLTAIGLALGQFLGGHARRCACGGGALLAVRSPAGTLAAVASVSIDELDRSLSASAEGVAWHADRVVEDWMVAPDGPPDGPEMARAALDEWIAAAVTGRAPTAVRTLVAINHSGVNDELRGTMDFGRTLPHYDFKAPGALALAWELYAPLLPHELRERGPLALAQEAAEEARSIVAAVNRDDD